MTSHCLLLCSIVLLSPIKSVEISDQRALVVNSKPFFPIMIWLQDPENFPQARRAGINTVAGYWPGSGGTKDVAEYLDRVHKAGFYGVMPYHSDLKGHPALLGYIQDDEPDLPHLESETKVVPSSGLRINRKTPLWKIFDGVTHSWSVLDPLEGAGFTLELSREVELNSLAIWLTVSKGLAVAREVSFTAGGKEIARLSLENKKGRQEIPLREPLRCRKLSFRVHSTYPDDQVWGSISEIEGLDKSGNNVLLAPPQPVPRAWPAKTQEKYRHIRAADSSRPVFLTLTGYFLPNFGKWPDALRNQLYPQYVEATDVIGFDIYPIYGWNKPEWLHLVHDGVKELRRLAGKRPLYAWIETSRGGQWTGALERQKPVTPAHIRAEVWMAICRGATAIGYFTHVWKPSYKQFGVPPENVKAMREINDQITRLAPILLAAPSKRQVSISMTGGLKSDVLTSQRGDSLYVFAVNYDSRQQGGEATLKIAGLESGQKVEVVDENRTLTARDGAFSDKFEPLGVHIYKVSP